MKIQELRVGNILLMKITDSCQVRPIKVNEFLALSEHPEWAKPLEISEEILLKFGIIHRSFYVVGAGSCNKWQLDDFILLKNIDGKFYCPLSSYNPVLDYVHQLQNLYFALTGSELDTSNLL